MNCVVAQGTIRNVLADEGSLSHNDVFGVIATKYIDLSETVLIDRAVAGVICSTDRCATCCSNLSDSIANSCCTVPYCSAGCALTALDTFHAPLCCRDFTFLYVQQRLQSLVLTFPSTLYSSSASSPLQSTGEPHTHSNLLSWRALHQHIRSTTSSSSTFQITSSPLFASYRSSALMFSQTLLTIRGLFIQCAAVCRTTSMAKRSTSLTEQL